MDISENKYTNYSPSENVQVGFCYFDPFIFLNLQVFFLFFVLSLFLKKELFSFLIFFLL